jgi:hypothetical protein
VDDAVLGLKAQKVRDHYRKEYYPEAQVSWTIRPVADQPEFADVDLAVDEGKPAVVRKIRFRGNRHARARDLRKVMTQRQSNWLSIFTNDGMYEPGYLAADREAIRKVFMDKGYLGAIVGEPTIAYVGRKKIDVTFEVAEGPLYKMGPWRIDGATLFATNEMARGIAVPSGAVAGLAAIERGAQNVRDFYGSRGYIKTAVEPRVVLDTNAATASVAYQIREGALAYIQGIDIRGNAQTQDKVVRREIASPPARSTTKSRSAPARSACRTSAISPTSTPTPKTPPSPTASTSSSISKNSAPASSWSASACRASTTSSATWSFRRATSTCSAGRGRWAGARSCACAPRSAAPAPTWNSTLIEPWFLNGGCPSASISSGATRATTATSTTS